MSIPEVPIEQDLVDCVERGEISAWQAMTAQSCRDAAFARAQCDVITKKVEELEETSRVQPAPPKPECPIRLVTRG